MAIQGFLGSRQVFTAAEFSLAFPGSQTDRNLLSRAVANKQVDRVRRGTYVSKTGQFSHSKASPFDVAVAVAEDAVFAYTSALQLHGALHNLTNQTQFFSTHKLASFAYDGQEYLSYRPGDRRVASQSLFTVSGKAYRVTTREQTLVDCLVRPGLAGGPENVLRSLSGFAHVDAAKVAKLAADTTFSARARIGWVLETRREAWDVPNGALSALQGWLGAGPSYFWSSTPPKDNHWVNAWKLYLPDPEEEMASWLNG
ncbi:MAG: type IV toxin-antitoxin system AbiEi family antitoxin [Tessaracoccus sp.]